MLLPSNDILSGKYKIDHNECTSDRGNRSNEIGKGEKIHSPEKTSGDRNNSDFCLGACLLINIIKQYLGGDVTTIEHPKLVVENTSHISRNTSMKTSHASGNLHVSVQTVETLTNSKNSENLLESRDSSLPPRQTPKSLAMIIII